MRFGSRFLVLLLVCIAVVVGCSKSVAPILDGPGGGVRAAGSAAQTFRVQLHFVGPVVTLDGAFQPHVDRNADFYVSSNGDPQAPVDTVPAYSVLKQVRWRVVQGGAGAAALGTGETVEEAPVIVGAEAPQPAAQLAAGLHVLVLQAPARAGGGRVTVLFYVDFPPGAWWAGPDPALFPLASDGDGRGVDVTEWAHFTTAPAWPPDGRRYFGPDSFAYVPSQRRPVHDNFEQKTFYELYGDRIYARSEGDYVHANSWVAFMNGGYDRDSRYAPVVDASDPGLPPGYASRPDLFSALIPQGLSGSPSAFRTQLLVKLDNGNVLRASETASYPNFDPNSVFRNPHLAGYWRMVYPGKAYMVAQGVDSEGVRGRLTDDPIAIADRVDAGGGTPSDRLQRRQILTFFVRAANPNGAVRAAADAGTRGGVGRSH